MHIGHHAQMTLTLSLAKRGSNVALCVINWAFESGVCVGPYGLVLSPGFGCRVFGCWQSYLVSGIIVLAFALRDLHSSMHDAKIGTESVMATNLDTILPRLLCSHANHSLGDATDSATQVVMKSLLSVKYLHCFF